MSEVYIHPTATIDPGAEIGLGTKIWHYCHVMGGAQIGKHCVLGQNVFVGAQAKINDRVKIQNNVSVYDQVQLEDNVFCGPSVVFTNVINPRAFIERKDEYLRTVVKEGTTLGANSTILCGHTIGCYTMVGAGAVVTRNLPPYALALGVPARRVGWVCRCGSTLGIDNAPSVSSIKRGPRAPSDQHVTCQTCGSRYELVDNLLFPRENEQNYRWEEGPTDHREA